MARLVSLALLLAGCLYTDDLNTPPMVTLTIEHGSSTGTFTVGTRIEVEAMPKDREDGIVLPVAFDFFDEHGATPSDCEGQKFEGGQTASFVFFVAGTYTVVATTTDNQHARSAAATATITITDPAPSVTGGVTAEPVPACGAYPAGGPIGLKFEGAVNDTRGDGRPTDESCQPLSVPYLWHVGSGSQDGATHAVLTLARDDNDCSGTRSANDASDLSAPDRTHHVCLWPDPADGARSYVVSFDVHPPDANSPSKTISVGADQPPCITGTNIAGGSYIVDHAGSFTAQVTKLADDYDGYGSDHLTYRWSVWVPDVTSADLGSWIVVASRPHQESYTLDLSAFDLGEKPRLRVEALDSTNQPATCADSEMQCCQTSCNHADAACPGAAQCQKWVTWELELR